MNVFHYVVLTSLLLFVRGVCASFDQLPPETKQRIVSFVDKQSQIQTLRRVNSEFNQPVQGLVDDAREYEALLEKGTDFKRIRHLHNKMSDFSWAFPSKKSIFGVVPITIEEYRAMNFSGLPFDDDANFLLKLLITSKRARANIMAEPHVKLKKGQAWNDLAMPQFCGDYGMHITSYLHYPWHCAVKNFPKTGLFKFKEFAICKTFYFTELFEFIWDTYHAELGIPKLDEIPHIIAADDASAEKKAFLDKLQERYRFRASSREHNKRQVKDITAGFANCARMDALFLWSLVQADYINGLLGIERGSDLSNRFMTQFVVNLATTFNIGEKYDQSVFCYRYITQAKSFFPRRTGRFIYQMILDLIVYNRNDKSCRNKLIGILSSLFEHMGSHIDSIRAMMSDDTLAAVVIDELQKLKKAIGSNSMCVVS